MPSIIKKLIASSMIIIMSLYGFFGLSNGVSDDYTEGKYKNVILMIGDGMGDNTLAATKKMRNIVELNLDRMPVRGHSDIDSFIIPATDSAAGGTALATGIRVWINSVAVYPFVPINVDDTPVPITLCELAKSRGMAAGVVTTDSTAGATPSDFSAHVYSRKMTEEICEDQLKSNLDLIWGASAGYINKENANANGFTYVSTKTELDALEKGSRSFAQFSFDDLKYVKNDHDTPTIEEMTKKAIDILSADEDGFFLMVEGACIDKFSHSNDFDGCTMSVVEFDKAVGAALDFAEKDGETLVVVTADHETGRIKYNEKTSEYYYTSDSHSIIDVPLFVSATDAGFTNGKEVKNRQVSVQIARVLGFGKDEFPAQKAS